MGIEYFSLVWLEGEEFGVVKFGLDRKKRKPNLTKIHYVAILIQI